MGCLPYEQVNAGFQPSTVQWKHQLVTWLHWCQAPTLCPWWSRTPRAWWMPGWSFHKISYDSSCTQKIVWVNSTNTWDKLRSSLLDSLRSNEFWQLWFDRVQQRCCSCVRSRADVPEGSCAANALMLLQCWWCHTWIGGISGPPWIPKESQSITLFKQRNPLSTMKQKLASGHIWHIYAHKLRIHIIYTSIHKACKWTTFFLHPSKLLRFSNFHI